MPDCDETKYTASTSALSLRRCDSKNLDLTDLCNLGNGMGDIHPPIWGASVLEQYAKANGGNQIPHYIKESVHSNERTYITPDQVKLVLVYYSIPDFHS